LETENLIGAILFELSDGEIGDMVSQNVIPGRGKLGGASPMAFTEQGVALLRQRDETRLVPPLETSGQLIRSPSQANFQAGENQFKPCIHHVAAYA
jgi:hypothetical protein